MPCQSYDTNWAHDHDDSKIKKLKAECDKLARIACKAMTQLEKSGRADFILIEDDEIREWWTAHKEADRKEQARLAELERKKRVREEALARLSDEEKELLGLSKPKKASKKSVEDERIKEVLEQLDVLKSEYADWDYNAQMIEDDKYSRGWASLIKKKGLR